MFLKKVMENNQPLVKTAISLHREGNIPPTTFVLDLDMIRKNAAELKDEAVKNNLKMYLMVKSFNRNPFVSTIAVSEGFEGVVAVNFQGASVHDRYNIPIKHIGHLVQVPMHYILKALKLNPEVITVFSYIEAKRISASAKILGKRQDLLIRVYNKDNIFFYGQEGGVPEEDLSSTVSKIMKLENVNIVGLTAYPCLTYNLKKEDKIVKTNNLRTMLKAADLLRKKFKIDIKQINAPGNNFSEVFKILADAGATHLEPGLALLGISFSHALDDIKGTPSHVFVTEIIHKINGKGYAVGEGFWEHNMSIESNLKNALVGSSFDECMNNVLDIEDKGQGQVINYHGIITQGNKCKIGDTVISSSFVNMQETNAYTAAVSGIQSGNPKVEAIFDNGCHPVNENLEDIDIELIKDRLNYFK